MASLIIKTRPFESLKKLPAKLAGDFQNLPATSNIYLPHLKYQASNTKPKYTVI